jgi:hypothetical protein
LAWLSSDRGHGRYTAAAAVSISTTSKPELARRVASVRGE